MMKNAFYFTLKTILFVKIFRFFTWLFEKWLDKEAKVNFEIYDFTDWEKIIIIHELPSISRSKDNQAMKFGQLIKLREIFFLQNHVKNETGRLIPDLFLFLKNFK